MTDLKDRFQQIYDSDHVPWDTSITPPEIVAIVKELQPGAALDLGCGPGTTLHHLLANGWQADGVDFVQTAIDQAAAKLKSFPTEAFSLYCHDITQLDALTDLRTPYDLVIDIGCGHTLSGKIAEKYAAAIATRMAPGALLMLYAHGPREDSPIGWSPAEVQQLYGPYLSLQSQVLSTDTSTGGPSGWYQWQKAENDA